MHLLLRLVSAAALCGISTLSTAQTLPQSFARIAVMNFESARADGEGNIAGYSRVDRRSVPSVIWRGTTEPQPIDMTDVFALARPDALPQGFPSIYPKIIGFEDGVMWGTMGDDLPINSFIPRLPDGWSLWCSVDGGPAELVGLPGTLGTEISVIQARGNILVGAGKDELPPGSDRSETFYRLRFDGETIQPEVLGSTDFVWFADIGPSDEITVSTSGRVFYFTEDQDGFEITLSSATSLSVAEIDPDGTLILRVGGLPGQFGEVPATWTPEGGFVLPWTDSELRFSPTLRTGRGIYLGLSSRMFDISSKTTLWTPGQAPVPIESIAPAPRAFRSALIILEDGTVVTSGSRPRPFNGSVHVYVTEIMMPVDRAAGGRTDIAGLDVALWNPSEPAPGPDGRVDERDLSLYVERWLAGTIDADMTYTGTNPRDFRRGFADGYVDGADLSWFIEFWLAEAY